MSAFHRHVASYGFTCHNFGGVNGPFTSRQSSPPPGSSLESTNSSPRGRQTRPAIAPTARGRLPSVDDFRKLSTPNALRYFDENWYPSSPGRPLQESIEVCVSSRRHHRDPRECVQPHQFDSLLEGSFLLLDFLNFYAAATTPTASPHVSLHIHIFEFYFSYGSK